MVSIEELLSRGLGYIRIIGRDGPHLESIWWEGDDRALDMLTEGEKLLLLAGYSIHDPEKLGEVAVIIVDEPEREFWFKSPSGSQGKDGPPPDYIDIDLED